MLFNLNTFIKCGTLTQHIKISLSQVSESLTSSITSNCGSNTTVRTWGGLIGLDQLIGVKTIT